jgi:hypothetical protein
MDHALFVSNLTFRSDAAHHHSGQQTLTFAKSGRTGSMHF